MKVNVEISINVKKSKFHKHFPTDQLFKAIILGARCKRIMDEIYIKVNLVSDRIQVEIDNKMNIRCIILRYRSLKPVLKSFGKIMRLSE